MSLPFFHALIVLESLGFLISEVSRSHSETPQSRGLHWMSYQPITETSTWHHTTLTGDIHAPGRIWTAIPTCEWLQIHTLYHRGTGISIVPNYHNKHLVTSYLTQHQGTLILQKQSSSYKNISRVHLCTT